MLTRLKVQGFKNLIDLELRFGPLTCIAGPNGAGKSNVFDAIRFLSLLADRPLLEAARGVRGGADVTELFTSGGGNAMRLECDLLIADHGQDDLGQPAEASHTFLSYILELRLDRDDALDLPRITLVEEDLRYITKGKSRSRIGFPHSTAWRESVLGSSTRRTPYISMDPEERETPVVRLHADGMRQAGKSRRGGGNPSTFLAHRLPRTVLSSAQNADEHRTAVLVRQEMRQWRILQLEPTALRRPDELQAETRIDVTGAHVPATLFRLASTAAEPGRVYAEVGNRLSELIDDVRTVRVDRDEARRLLRFMLTDRSGVDLPASSLSDGTLRFVALAVMERDPLATGVLCLEEPENGIHPARMEAMIRLLQDMAVDATLPVDDDNPLRQVILSTHSPLVASAVAVDELVFAQSRSHGAPRAPQRGLEVLPVDSTWRTERGARAVATGDVLAYLGAMHRPGDAANGRKTVLEVVGDQLPLPFEHIGR